jgi:hypothetical protein
MTMPGLFRQVFESYGLDYRTPSVARSIRAEFVAVLDAELRGPSKK